MSKYNVLLVDDQEENLSITRDLLHRWGYSVDAVSNGDEAIECVRNQVKEYAVAVLDYRMPGKNGAEVAAEIRPLNDEIILLMHSAYPSVESLTATIRARVLNFIDKNEDVARLRTALEQACVEYEKVRRVKPSLGENERARLIRTLGMVGISDGLARVAQQVEVIRPSQKPALILGETGVGKEHVARALHTGNPNTFFVVNCAAFQGSALVESELFGHEKGAFTGAIVRKVGILEAARGGTVYLDELHYLDTQTQGKLLRAIREKKIRRVGGLHEEDIDCRIVASTWPNIEERVANGTFLRDLYYRLKFFTIQIPPLRERVEDIRPLVLHFADLHEKETGVRKHFLERTLSYLEQHEWPGNVGELDGYISALLTEYPKETIDHTQLDSKFLFTAPPSQDSSFAQLEARQKREKRELIGYAVRTSKSIMQAAQRLGLKSSSLNTMITRFGMRDELHEEKP
jgi:two-component system response regulator AtoC